MKYDMEQWLEQHMGSIIEYKNVKKTIIHDLYDTGEGEDVSFHDDNNSTYGVLTDAINLGDGKWLLGFVDVITFGNKYMAEKKTQYHPLDHMTICYAEKNQAILDEIFYINDKSNINR